MSSAVPPGAEAPAGQAAPAVPGPHTDEVPAPPAGGGTPAGKLHRAEEILSQLGSVLVAFSGGVDSSLMLALAMRTLGADRVLAVTAAGSVGSDEDLASARAVAAQLNAPHSILSFEELDIPGFAANPPDRCYLCRGQLYVGLQALRTERGLAVIVDGSIAGDLDDYRPGMRAAAEAGVRSPLAEAGFTKEEVRAACRELGLSVWDRPASPCLASRFPYGERITEEGLRMVAEGERFLRGRGFPVVRVRHHGPLARVEVPAADVPRLCEEPLRTELVQTLRGLGYLYVCVDLLGFRSGSLNEALPGGGA